MPDIDRLKSALADRYTIEREIGGGGMATVYLATDVKHDREVAIKVLRPELSAALGTERFLREIKIAANLTHPHVLTLIDSGEAAGMLFYVMPYIEGSSLRERLSREGELPVGDTVRILREVVDALAYAHGKGIVHRDIKPDNILITDRHAIVMDFGVAKAVTDAVEGEGITTTGLAIGTPSYMAPEQAAADDLIDHRADIYAIGAMAYELLTGSPPFTGTTAQAILAAQVTEEPRPITERRGSVPSALDQFVLKCLEKRPADRWQTAEELLPQLEGLATPSGGVTPTQATPLAVHRRGPKRAWTIGAVVLVVLAVISVALV
ncbi:MAG: serine/threonine-protein kinase, partial [Gemmatimonadales bacterium]